MDRQVIVDVMVTVHNAGFKHKHLKDRHPLIQDGNVRLISFEKATQEPCDRSAAIVVGGLEPYAEELECDELYTFGGVSCWGELHPLEVLDNPHALAELGPKSDSIEHRLEKAYTVIERYLEKYEPEKWAARQAEPG
ncbi:hypothetical protein BV25DRAFT_1838915 [Artomyces pyxidatus]|uniref:Uncharacterized protein n=1 Tax=Artomyces pyxidatus TaxID=48021 RepID=A0ACB8SZ71_9AGAM|nr:hypothetical protein BV25DRAFT_1838915 [Artomyces pyxidatus]